MMASTMPYSTPRTTTAAVVSRATANSCFLATRKHEFAVALLTTAAVVVLGVEYGIVLAIIASIVDHLRHSYSPLNSVLVKSPEGHWQPIPAGPGARTEEGLVVYRFGTGLYYANASRLV